MIKLTNLRLTAVGLLAAFLLTACNLPVTPTPLAPVEATRAPIVEETTPEPAAIGAACVVGTWQVLDLQTYIQSMLPSMIQGAEINVETVEGGLSYTFNPDGSSTGTADNFIMQVKVQMNGLSLPGNVVVNGSSQGQYQVNEGGDLIQMSSLDAGDLTVSATVAGVPVVNKTPVLNLFSFSGPKEGSASVNYQCIGDQMQMTVEIQNLGERVITLQRVR